jgi:hypothetical protein
LEFVARCNRFTFLSPAEDNNTVKIIKICRHANASGVIIKEPMKLVLRHTNKRSLKIGKEKKNIKAKYIDVVFQPLLLTNSKGGRYDETWICGAVWWIIIIQVKPKDQVLIIPILCLGVFLTSVWIFCRVRREKQGNIQSWSNQEQMIEKQTANLCYQRRWLVYLFCHEKKETFHTASEAHSK